MYTQTIFVCSLIVSTLAMPRLKPEPEFPYDRFATIYDDVKPYTQEGAVVDLPNDDDAMYIFRTLSGFKNMDLDGIASTEPKNDDEQVARDLPMPRFDDAKEFPPMPFDGFEKSMAKSVEKAPEATPEFLKPQPGVAPKFTGSFTSTEDVKDVDDNSTEDKAMQDYIDAPVSNPAAWYLEGADLDKVPAPKCKMVGCTGPVPNDGSVSLGNGDSDTSNQACHQTFVPLNSCTDKKGYPIGMICQICCDCDAPFVAEFQKSRGIRLGYTE